MEIQLANLIIGIILGISLTMLVLRLIYLHAKRRIEKITEETNISIEIYFTKELFNSGEKELIGIVGRPEQAYKLLKHEAEKREDIKVGYFREIQQSISRIYIDFGSRNLFGLVIIKYNGVEVDEYL